MFSKENKNKKKYQGGDREKKNAYVYAWKGKDIAFTEVMEEIGEGKKKKDPQPLHRELPRFSMRSILAKHFAVIAEFFIHLINGHAMSLCRYIDNSVTIFTFIEHGAFALQVS